MYFSFVKRTVWNWDFYNFFIIIIKYFMNKSSKSFFFLFFYQLQVICIWVYRSREYLTKQVHKYSSSSIFNKSELKNSQRAKAFLIIFIAFS